MKKSIYNILLLAMMMVVAVTFTACGGDNDEPGTEDNQQRIELTVSGDTKGWVVMGNFYGYTTDPYVSDKTCTIRCNQSDHVVMNNNTTTVMIGGLVQRQYPVTVTLDGSSKLFLDLQITKNGEYDVKDVPDITVTLKGYKGARLTNSFTKSYKATTVAAIGFHADKSDDKHGVEGEISQEIYH